MLKPRLILALITGIIMFLDNLTTWIAVQNGAAEINPLVAFFLQHPILYTVFTVAKILLGFYLVYRFIDKRMESLIIWCIIMFFFIRAIIINTINIFY